ncbi:MAG: putative nucleotidyltransferase [Candidatus Omnitrophota bacterium]|jgi:predicted nucleotidyltransferase
MVAIKGEVMVKNKSQVLKLIEKETNSIKKYGVKKLGLFGSFARGENKTKSDLDFVVELNKKTLDSYMGLKFFLEDLFKKHIDLVLIDSIKPRLRRRILKEVIYAKGL